VFSTTSLSVIEARLGFNAPKEFFQKKKFQHQDLEKEMKIVEGSRGMIPPAVRERRSSSGFDDPPGC